MTAKRRLLPPGVLTYGACEHKLNFTRAGLDLTSWRDLLGRWTMPFTQVMRTKSSTRIIVNRVGSL